MTTTRTLYLDDESVWLFNDDQIDFVDGGWVVVTRVNPLSRTRTSYPAIRVRKYEESTA